MHKAMGIFLSSCLIALFLFVNPSQGQTVSVTSNYRKPIRCINNATKILERVKAFTGFDVDLGEIMIVVYPSRGDLQLAWQRMNYGRQGGFVAWYDRRTNTIYTCPQVTAYVLAHEFTHALADKYFGRLPPVAMQEVYSNYVEENIKLGLLE